MDFYAGVLLECIFFNNKEGKITTNQHVLLVLLEWSTDVPGPPSQPSLSLTFRERTERSGSALGTHHSPPPAVHMGDQMSAAAARANICFLPLRGAAIAALTWRHGGAADTTWSKGSDRIGWRDQRGGWEEKESGRGHMAIEFHRRVSVSSVGSWVISGCR